MNVLNRRKKSPSCSKTVSPTFSIQHRRRLPEPVSELVEFGAAEIAEVLYTSLPPIGKFIAAAAFAFSLIFAGVLIVLELNKGTLTIESEADDVPIRIMQGDDVVEKLTVTKSPAKCSHRCGKLHHRGRW